MLTRGFALTLRHQRILWWVFAVNFILGGLGSSGIARALGSALHHSLAGEKLANGFDVGMFLELVGQPDVKLFSHAGPVFIFAALYFLFLLFITPGIISVYLGDRRFSTGEFFRAAGAFFWIFVRLALWSLIPFLAVHILQHLISELASYVGDRVAYDQAGFLILVLGSIPILLAFIWIRLWFDLAQVRAVAGNDCFTRRNAARTFRSAIRRAWNAYWAYVFVCVLAWIVCGVAVLLWIEVPARAVWLTFLLLEVVMLAQIFARLWQKACATTWYTMNPEPVALMPGPAPLEPYTPMAIQEPSGTASDIDAPIAAEPEPAPEPLPPSEPQPRDTTE